MSMEELSRRALRMSLRAPARQVCADFLCGRVLRAEDPLVYGQQGGELVLGSCCITGCAGPEGKFEPGCPGSSEVPVHEAARPAASWPRTARAAPAARRSGPRRAR